MSRKLLKLRYDGTDYHGWQVQNNAITVQETLQNAMEKLYGQRPDVCGCSRTDSGVHAEMFCCHFDEPAEIPNENVILGLNRYLPNDVAVYECIDVSDDFHARYSCVKKTYIYRFMISPYRNPFNYKYAYNYKREIDIEKAKDFCEEIIGTYDFSAFSSIDRTTDDTVRTIYSASVKREGEIVEFTITGNGFLYNMVRILAGTLISVSEGRISVNEIKKIIDSKDRTLAGATAPACGLTLARVDYI